MLAAPHSAVRRCQPHAAATRLTHRDTLSGKKKVLVKLGQQGKYIGRPPRGGGGGGPEQSNTTMFIKIYVLGPNCRLPKGQMAQM